MILHHAIDVLRGVHFWPLCMAIACYLLGSIAIGFRLSAAASVTKRHLSLPDAVAIGLSGVLASHLAFGCAAGEIARLAWLARAAPDRIVAAKRALAILAVDRIADGIVICVLVLCALQSHRTLFIAGAPLLVAILALFVLPRVLRQIEISQLLRGVLAAIPSALCAWVFDLLRLYAVSCALNTPLAIDVLAALAMGALIGMQAPTPGGLGAVEASMVAAGAAVGIETSTVLAVALLDRAISLTLGSALGALASAHLARLHDRRIR